MSSTEERLNAYESVNQSKSLEELSKVIKSLADDEGRIPGRHKDHDAYQMSAVCLTYNNFSKRALTREYGIRQQAIMLHQQGKINS